MCSIDAGPRGRSVPPEKNLVSILGVLSVGLSSHRVQTASDTSTVHIALILREIVTRVFSTH